MERTAAEIMEFGHKDLVKFLDEGYHWPLDHVYVYDANARGWLIATAEDDEFFATSYAQGDENNEPDSPLSRVKMLDELTYPVTVVSMRYYADSLAN
jgi:hypothetical protein